MCKQRGSRLQDGTLHDEAHARWTRRQFLRGVALAGTAATLGLGGTRVSVAEPTGLLHRLAALGGDRILVMIQLSGGNDGLNTVIPLGNDLYRQARPSLGIRDQSAIRLADGMGLHPSLSSWERLYKDGRMGIVQNVGYAEPELSHFMSTDVWLSGRDVADFDSTGWSGRFFEHMHPDVPTTLPDHPLAMQIGSSTPLLFQGQQAHYGVTFPDPSMLDRLTSGGSIHNEEDVPNTSYGEEIAFARSVANAAFVHAGAIRDAYDTASNEASYPGNTLARDLAIVARLIRGGLGAQIYHVTLGGFDTHASQSGSHATLLARLGGAVNAFINDLTSDGHMDRVCAVTFSEFGRRIRENGSSGTDHGTAAPMFVFGNHLTGGTTGNMPDLAHLDTAGNLVASTDFRSVYGSIMKDWFSLPEGQVDTLFGGAWPDLALFSGSVATHTGRALALPIRLRVESVYPNPLRTSGRVVLHLQEAGAVSCTLVDALGRTVGRFGPERILQVGRHEIILERPGHLAAGSYILRVTHAGESAATPLVLK